MTLTQEIKQADGFHVTLPFNLGDGLEYREYIITRAWINGSGKPWCDAHYYLGDERHEVHFWPKTEQLAEIAFDCGALELEV